MLLPILNISYNKIKTQLATILWPLLASGRKYSKTTTTINVIKTNVQSSHNRYIRDAEENEKITAGLQHNKKTSNKSVKAREQQQLLVTKSNDI